MYAQLSSGTTGLHLCVHTEIKAFLNNTASFHQDLHYLGTSKTIFMERNTSSYDSLKIKMDNPKLIE